MDNAMARIQGIDPHKTSFLMRRARWNRVFDVGSDALFARCHDTSFGDQPPLSEAAGSAVRRGYGFFAPP